MGSGLPVSLSPDASAVDMDLYEAQTLADALKWYLQELPTPLIPPALYSDLVHMAQGKHTWAVPTPWTSMGLEKLWEAPKKTSQHFQLALTPSPAQCCTKGRFYKAPLGTPPAPEQHSSFWEMLWERREIQGAALPPPQRGLLPLQCLEEEVLPARTGSCQGWVMLAPEESVIIIFWLCCLGIFSCNLINSWLYMGTKNSQLFQLSAIRKCL